MASGIRRRVVCEKCTDISGDRANLVFRAQEGGSRFLRNVDNILTKPQAIMSQNIAVPRTRIDLQSAVGLNVTLCSSTSTKRQTKYRSSAPVPITVTG